MPPEQVVCAAQASEPLVTVQVAPTAAMPPPTHWPVGTDWVVSTSHCRRKQPVFCTGLHTGMDAGGAQVAPSAPSTRSLPSVAPIASDAASRSVVASLGASVAPASSTCASAVACIDRSSDASPNGTYADGSPDGPPKRHAAARRISGAARIATRFKARPKDRGFRP